MRLELLNWDSDGENYDINVAGTYEPVIQPGNAMPAATAQFIDLGQENPFLVGKAIQGGYFTFSIVARGDLDNARDQLNQWFQVKDYTFKKLLAQDLDDSNRQWYLEGFPVTPPMLANNSPAQFIITLALKQPYWIEAVEQSDAWNIVADTDTNTITTRGNVDTLPRFELVANSPKGTASKKFFCGVHQADGLECYVPVDLTPSALNTAALVSGGKMLASGNDLRVVMDGVNQMRWFGGGGINTTTTHIWTYIYLKAAPAMTLKIALDGSTTPALLAVNYTGAVPSFPYNGILRIGNEYISYTVARVIPLTQLIEFQLVTGSRASKGSTIAAHSVGDAVYWIQHDVWVMYNDPAATAPVTDNNLKTNLDLATSTNSSWVIDEFVPYQASSFPLMPSMSGSGFYVNVNNSPSYGMVFPIDVLGLRIARGGSSRWQIQCPLGVSNFVASGEKWRYGTTWATYQIEAYAGSLTVPPIVYVTEATPSVAEAWEAVSINVAMPEEPTVIRFTGDGSTIGTTLPANYSRMELDSITMTIANPLTVYIPVAEDVSYVFDGSLTNNETDYGIVLNKLATKTSDVTTIDCDELEVYNEDGQRIRGAITFSGDKRNEWMTLLPGSNVLAWSDTGTNDVTVTTYWRGRNTI